MIEAYVKLFQLGYAKSVEVWQNKELVGGLYGVDLGNGIFCGESMFTLVSNASKFGLVGFTQAIMLDLRKYGVKVSTIMPGSVATYFNNHIPDDADAWKIQPEDIGQMVADLLQMNPRTLPSKIEVRPAMVAKK